MKSIKDILYFDTEKARSLISQLDGGLINEISKAIEEEHIKDSDLGLDIKILKAGKKDTDSEKLIRTEKIELYHEILNEIERKLNESKGLTLINDLYKSSNDKQKFFEETRNLSYIKAKGWATFENIARFKKIFDNFNEIQRLIFNADLLENPEVIQLRNEIDQARRDAKKHSKQQAKDLGKILSLEKKFDEILAKETGAAFLDEDFISRMKIFMDTFSPNRLNFRLAPFEDSNDFQILGNLKEKYIVEGNFDNIIYTYGSKPNIKLSTIGIVTSAPQKTDNRLNPNIEFDDLDDDNLTNEQIFDKAFRKVFDSFEAFEKFFFAAHYPKVSISPIAIFREINISD